MPAPESCSVPADIVVPPEYVLAPERTSVPGPSIPRKPGVAPSLMTPEMVWVVPAGGVKFGSPEIRKLLARVKFEPLINDSVVSGASDTKPGPNASLLPAIRVPELTMVAPV